MSRLFLLPAAFALALLGCETRPAPADNPGAHQSRPVSAARPAAGAGPAAALSAPNSSAARRPAAVTVYAVEALEPGHRPPAFGCFALAQVRGNDPAVVGRINRQLVRRGLHRADDTTLREQPARLAVRRARRQHLADLTTGLSGCAYQVQAHTPSLLAFQLSAEYNGAYTYQMQEYVVFDLRTGRQLRLADLLRPADTLRLQQLWRRRINARVAALLRQADSADAADLRQRWNWDPSSQQLRFGPDQPRLSEFTIGPNGLAAMFRLGVHHSLRGTDLDPAAEYVFTPVELRPFLRADAPWPGGAAKRRP
jgi:hypothetical protein